MRRTLALVAAILIASPVAFTGCDRTVTTETVHRDADADGSKTTVKRETTNLDTGTKTTETHKETVDVK